MKGVHASKPFTQNRAGVHMSHPGAPKPFIQKCAARRPNGDGWGSNPPRFLIGGDEA